ncbi:MAG: hypothetical protein J0L75_12420 [Spirochaetes bacterium]|nr:hypothetical protein [Spirochaetota bacterium]
MPASVRRMALLIALSPASAFAWGDGHEVHLLQVMDLLPPAILAFLVSGKSREAILHESHYPDDFTKFTPAEVGEEAMALLAKHKLPHRYSLHSETGKAVNLLLLARAFAQKDPLRAGTWFAALSHTLADEAACNHDPLLEPIKFAYLPYGLPMKDGCPLDLADLVKSPDGKNAWETALRDLPPTGVPASLEAAILAVYAQPMEANRFLTRRGGAIARSYNQGASPEDLRSAQAALAECGAEGVRTALLFTRAAWEYSGDAPGMELNEALLHRAEEGAARVVRERPLADDAIYAGALEGYPGEAPVAVLVEPSVAMDRGAFGFNAKTILSAILREWASAKIPSRVLDLRDGESLARLAPANARLLVVCAANQGVPEPVKKAAARFYQAGGKILWIGGKDGGQLGALSKALKPGSTALIPISQKYGDLNEKTVGSLRLVFAADWAASIPGSPFRLAHNPNTRAGWHVPRCALTVDLDAGDLIPLAFTENGGERACIAAAGKDETGRVRSLFLPIYLLAPFAWTTGESMADFSRPRLDSMGASVLAAALKTLTN